MKRFAPLLCLLLSFPAAAQYPDRPVTMLTGYPARGLVDVDYRPDDVLRPDRWREYKLHTDILRRIGVVKN